MRIKQESMLTRHGTVSICEEIHSKDNIQDTGTKIVDQVLQGYREGTDMDDILLPQRSTDSGSTGLQTAPDPILWGEEQVHGRGPTIHPLESGHRQDAESIRIRTR